MRTRHILPALTVLVCLAGCKDSRIDYSAYLQELDETYTAIPANDFLCSIGVNSSINSRGEYIEKTLDCMQYLGARWIRSGYSGQKSIDEMRYLYDAAGIRFSIMLGSGTRSDGQLHPEETVDGARVVAQMGALIALEGVNEPNNWTVRYNGVESGGSKSWVALAQAHTDFYELCKEDDILCDYPVWSLSEPGAEFDNVGLQYLTIPEDVHNTLFPAGTRFADCANCHNYIVHPGWPGVHDNQTWLTSDPTSNSPLDGLYDNFGTTWGKGFDGYTDEQLRTLRRVTTETGTTINEAVSEQMQGLLYLNLYLCQYKRGWEYTSMYILRDRVDEGGNQTFGFFGRDYKPRIAATYLHNLTTILDDDESIPTPGTISYKIPNKPNTVHHMLMQKADGTFCLVLWGERYTGGSDRITLKFGQAIEHIAAYDPTVGTAPVENYYRTRNIDLNMTDHPIILVFRL